MASLTTVYMISMFLTSVVGMGSAFLGNRIYPLKGGAEPQPIPEVASDQMPEENLPNTV